MKCRRAGHRWMEVLNVKKSHFQHLCSQTPTQEESKSISRHAALQKTQSPCSLLRPKVQERTQVEPRTQAGVLRSGGGGHAQMQRTCVSRRAQGLQGKLPGKKRAWLGVPWGPRGEGSAPSLLWGLCVRTRSVVSNSFCPHGLQPARLLCPWDFPGKNTGVGCHFLLQGIFPSRDRTHVSCSIPGSHVHSLVRELRSCKPYGTTKKKSRSEMSW